MVEADQLRAVPAGRRAARGRITTSAAPGGEDLRATVVSRQGRTMSETVLEIHVPLTRAPGSPELDGDEYAFPWIDEVETLLAELDGPVVEHDAAEEWSNEQGEPEFLFFVTGGTEAELIAVARSIARLPTVPTGVYATVADAEGERGEGEPLDL